MAKMCTELLDIYKEIFDEAYLMGRSSGSEGIFICPNLAFESFFQEKLMDLIARKANPEVLYEVAPREQSLTNLH